MDTKRIKTFVCPICKSSLHLKGVDDTEQDILNGVLMCTDNHHFKIEDSIPDFTIYSEEEKNKYAQDLFKNKARDYDKFQHLSFETFYEDETELRNSMINRLNLKADSHVLEVNAGTGRDSLLISKRLSEQGLLEVQDISKDMLIVCGEKLKHTKTPYQIHQGNASRLPYKDKTFDAVYSFGGVGMNTYSNNKEAIAELLRVTKKDGRIVFGGLGLAPWLRNTFFAKVLINHNTHYANELQFSDFPVEARNLNITWILGGAGFVVDFTVGEGEPLADFNYEIPGPRGGTLLTRYLGNLEGVTPATKELAMKAREKLGISMHTWLDELIKREAENVLNNKNI